MIQNLAERLCAAVVAHDLDAMVACFAEDYRNETPAHPARGFVGRDQVRENWERLFAAIPDLAAEVVRATTDGAELWTEWEMRGTRPDGERHHLRGVIIFGLSGERAAWARFYLEPVDPDPSGVAEAISSIVEPGR